MTSLPELLQQGAAYGWLFVPTAILLGALHGLEPGHSKSMMAAFIVAVHGTVRQAVLLGISATVSHTAVVWLVALGGMYLGRTHDMEVNEPYFQLASAVIILAIGMWMLVKMYRVQHHAHHHHEHHEHGHEHHGHEHLSEDAHAQAHANEIEQRFTGQPVTTAQIILFGLTGGLIPCPAAITVLLLCLQLKHIALGLTLVLCFSIGLALTLVASGVVAALGVRAASRRMSFLPKLIRNAPYLAGGVMLLIGAFLAVQSLLIILHA